MKKQYKRRFTEDDLLAELDKTNKPAIELGQLKLKQMIASHSCEKSEGKIVLFSIDKLGVIKCGYCNEVIR